MTTEEKLISCKIDILMNTAKTLGFKITSYEYIEDREGEVLMVPDNIHISESGIMFNKNNLMLAMSMSGQYCVTDAMEPALNCKLIKIDKCDLVPGDIAYRSDKSDEDFTDLYYYCIILPEGKHVYVLDDFEICANSLEHDKWYKVVEA